MEKILGAQKATKIAKNLKKAGNKIVLAGGCFDLLHSGHILFLRKAKEQGDILFLLLESDESVRKLKGEARPINTQNIRAKTLSKLPCIDYIIKLSKLPTDSDYDRLIAQLEPDVIAVTRGEPNLDRRIEQAKKAGGIVKSVTRRTKHSTKDLARSFQK